MNVRPAECVAIHNRLAKCELEVEQSRAYWQILGSTQGPIDAQKLFETSVFGAKSLARVRMLLANLRQRFDSYPTSLGVLADWPQMTAETRRIICHWHLQLSDPLYRRFTASTLDGLASGKVSVEGAPDSDSDQLVLDPDRIRHILAETERVADLLKSVMINDETSDEEDFPPNQVTAFRADQAAAATLSKRHLQPETSPSDSAAPNLVAASHPVLEGLQPRYHDFVKALITRPHWNSAEFESLARQHRLLPQGAVDSINEWSSDRFGDFLIESDENRVIVQLDLLPTE